MYEKECDTILTYLSEQPLFIERDNGTLPEEVERIVNSYLLWRYVRNRLLEEKLIEFCKEPTVIEGPSNDHFRISPNGRLLHTPEGHLSAQKRKLKLENLLLENHVEITKIQRRDKNIWYWVTAGISLLALVVSVLALYKREPAQILLLPEKLQLKEANKLLQPGPAHIVDSSKFHNTNTLAH